MAVCPTYRETGEEGMVARGRLALVESMLDGEIGLTRGLVERIARCIGCRACEAVCPSGIDVAGVFTAVREQVSRSSRYRRLTRTAARFAIGGEEGLPSHALRLMAWLQQAAYERAPGTRLLPYWRNGARRTFPGLSRRPLADLLPERSTPSRVTGRVAFFPGCATNLFYPATGLALVKVLNGAGFEVITPRGWRCCGLPFQTLGDRETAAAMAADNLGLFSRLGVDTIVTACSSCALALQRQLPRLLGPDHRRAEAFSGSVQEIHVFLSRHGVQTDRAPGEEKVRVTWHDSCHLRWGLDITREPRSVIGGLPGVEFIETAGAGDCCGGGGFYSLRHYDLALKIGARRAEAIAGTGADIVATGCPGCRAQLNDVLRRAGSHVRVMHTLELMAGLM